MVVLNIIVAAAAAGTFVLLFGFYKPMLPVVLLYGLQIGLLLFFVAEKVIRYFNITSKGDFWRANWHEAVLILLLAIFLLGAGRWFGDAILRHIVVGGYLIWQVVNKFCRTSVRLAASGRSPAFALIGSFVFLIIAGSGLLMLPRAAAEGKESIGFVDALFTSTSAVCVTGLVVKDTGSDFSFMGQTVILSLIQLGGLGIVVFGAVFAMLLGQAFSLRESVAMQDLLSARTVGRIGTMIAFIFTGTLVFEAAGAIAMYGMWNNVADSVTAVHQQWFCSIFHSISAFCNAGFSLFSDSFERYDKFWPVYGVIAPLIILGGLGFGVLYDLFYLLADRIKRLLKKIFSKHYRFSVEPPKRMLLQTKVVLSVSAFLIIVGMLLLLLFENAGTVDGSNINVGLGKAFFQSVTARTAGFNTVDIGELSGPSKFILILLMFVGGSPGSTAGGIKTVTLAVVVISAITTFRKRRDVEMFRRSIRLAVVGRAVTVTLLFVFVLFATTMTLSITEQASGFSLGDIFFESASALGTVGLTTGLTPYLSTPGKLIITVVMLIGRLGPLTLLAALTFNLKSIKYSYPEESLIVG